MSILNGRILQVGSMEKIAPVEKYELDDSFKDLIIMPGLVEGHSHYLKVHCGINYTVDILIAKNQTALFKKEQKMSLS